MTEKSFFKARLYFTALATLAIGSLLAWNYFHGGVPSHHILAKEELPEISNWWGGLLIPVLAWFLSYRVQTRIYNSKAPTHTSKQIRFALYGFVGALVYGILVATSFAFEYTDITGKMMLALLPLALFLPIYRAEFFLGFIMGMTVTFGAVLPTGIYSIFATVGFAIHRYIRQGILYLASKLGIKST